MPGSQVHDVHVVAYARSVRRVVVVTPNMQPFAAPDGHLSDKWNEIVRCAAGIFADQAAFVGIQFVGYRLWKSTTP